MPLVVRVGLVVGPNFLRSPRTRSTFITTNAPAQITRNRTTGVDGGTVNAATIHPKTAATSKMVMKSHLGIFLLEEDESTELVCISDK
jgi:hypothetical protein